MTAPAWRAGRRGEREERWLEERHPSYAACRRRVRELIPLVY